MMEATFNTLERGWIPVVAEDDKEELLGILQVIEKAHELKEISSASPLEEYILIWVESKTMSLPVWPRA